MKTGENSLKQHQKTIFLFIQSKHQTLKKLNKQLVNLIKYLPKILILWKVFL